MLPGPGFVSGIDVAVVVVGRVQVISGTVCAVLAWRYDLRGNSQQGGKQRQKQLQMESRYLLALIMFRQLQYYFVSFNIMFPKPRGQQVTLE